jgi:hypothetical protein
MSLSEVLEMIVEARGGKWLPACAIKPVKADACHHMKVPLDSMDFSSRVHDTVEVVYA